MDILAELVPILVTAIAALVGWAILRLEKIVKKTDTELDDKVFEAVKKAFKDLDGDSPDQPT